MSDLFGKHIVGFLTRWLIYSCSHSSADMVLSVKACAQSSGPEVIKLFSCSAQLRLKFILLINVKMPTIVGILTFISRINYRIW